MFTSMLTGRVTGLDFAVAQQTGVSKFVRKVWQTSNSRCDFLPVLEPNLRRRCVEITSTASFDAIILSAVLLRDLPLPEGVPIVGDTHNVEFDVLARTSLSAESFVRRQYARCQVGPRFRAEGRCARKVDLLLATSERDRLIFQQELSARRVEVIPNGVDVTEFSPAKTSGEPTTVLFTGLMSYYPNQQAVRWFLDCVFPLLLKMVPRARLIVAGARPPRWLIARRSDVVEVTGAVSDMCPFFERARVVIAPLMIGGGTRVKILEAQAMARPVVSTSLGAEGLDARDGHSIIVANEAQHFAAQVGRLLADDNLAIAIGENGRRQVVAEYDWNRIGERLEYVLRQNIGLIPRGGDRQGNLNSLRAREASLQLDAA
jgi:glycosyltransferase involved in cell wall biosynthesis